jgi:glycosyltransferase involved in cell wall biosynthesis
MKIKVLNVINSLNIGGAQSLLKNFILDAKKSSDFEIDVCVLYPNGVFLEELEKEGVRVFNLNSGAKYNFFMIFEILEIIKRGEYNIVHVHLFPASFFVAVASIFLDRSIKFIFTEHSIYNRRRAFRIFKVLDYFTYLRYRKIICVSKQVKSSLEKWLPSASYKTVIIRSGIPLNALPGKQLQKIYDVLFVGRLERVKGVDILLRAAGYLKKKYSMKIRIGIVGTGVLLSDLKRLSINLGINNTVEFLGVRGDILSLLDKSSIFVLPSRWEGLPISILEAMSRNVPVIATSVGGISEIINDGEDGVLVTPENPELLARVIIYLLENEGLRAKLVTNAFKKVKEEFSIDRYTSDLLNLYKNIIEIS